MATTCGRPWRVRGRASKHGTAGRPINSPTGRASFLCSFFRIETLSSPLPPRLAAYPAIWPAEINHDGMAVVGIGVEDYGFLKGGRGVSGFQTCNIQSAFGFSGGFLGLCRVFGSGSV
jgi:hypothetical protein